METFAVLATDGGIDRGLRQTTSFDFGGVSPASALDAVVSDDGRSCFMPRDSLTSRLILEEDLVRLTSTQQKDSTVFHARNYLRSVRSRLARRSSSNADILNAISYEINISGFDASGILQFSSTQSSAVQTVSSPTPYVFLGDTNPVNFIAARQDPNFATIVAADSTGSGGDITLNSMRLLARLALEHLTPNPSTATGIYSVSIKNTANTFALQAAGQTAIDSSSYSLANSGTVTISAVPEPSSMILFASVSMLGAAGGYLRRRAARRQRLSSW